MTTTIIHIDLDAVDERLHRGELWAKGWNDWASPESATCLHGAIRYCQPVKGDAHLIERVGARFGFGTRDNDNADGWEQIKAKVIPDITDDMLADTFGPNWGPIVALVRRAATLTHSTTTSGRPSSRSTSIVGALTSIAWRTARCRNTALIACISSQPTIASPIARAASSQSSSPSVSPSATQPSR